MTKKNIYKFGFIFLIICGMTGAGLSLGTQNKTDKKDTLKDVLSEKEVIEEMKKNFIPDKPTGHTPPTLKIVSPGQGGRIITNMDKTYVTITIEAQDKESGVKMVCGTRMTKMSKPEFITDETPPYRLVFEKTPLEQHKFIVFSINNAGLFAYKTITVNVKKVNSFHIVPVKKQ